MVTSIIGFIDAVQVKRAKARCVKLELDTPVCWFANLQIGSDSEAGTKIEPSTVYEEW